ncbi:MAG: UbiX family flavin prenyltransferase [Bacteroidales bacterium]
MTSRPNIAIGVTGASGAIYAHKLISSLMDIAKQWSSLRVVYTDSAKIVWEKELTQAQTFSNKVIIEDNHSFMSPLASGSGGIDCMFICPCSMGMLGRIANGISNDLISRSADVMLKERRQLILVCRESPLNNIHIANMQKISSSGGVIYPASPSFYSEESTIDELINNFVLRLLLFAGFDVKLDRWGI